MTRHLSIGAVVALVGCATILGDDFVVGDDDDAATSTTATSGSGGAGGTGGTGGTTTVNTSSTGGAGACYQNAGACDPTDPTSCGVGEACDLGGEGFECFPPPNDVPEGGACDSFMGPWCEHGLTCLGGSTCSRFCCTDGDCVAGTCQPFGRVGELEVRLCM